jgi:hypothetical protein
MSSARMKAAVVIAACLLGCLIGPAHIAFAAAAFRPPAVPLVVFDPYMSIWSEANHLADHQTRFWDGRVQSLVSLARIDGKAYRLMGGRPRNIPSLPQTSVKVLPVETRYTFANREVKIELTFVTPRLPARLRYITLPVTYITWHVESRDGRRHTVQIYFSASSQIALNDRFQIAPLVCRQIQRVGLTIQQSGNVHQHIFDVIGDQTGLDWGYLYTAAAHPTRAVTGLPVGKAIDQFISTGEVAQTAATHQVFSTHSPVQAFVFDLGSVGHRPRSRSVMIAYDEIYGLDYFGDYQRPYWRHIFVTPQRMLAWAHTHYKAMMALSHRFDASVMRDARQIGGRRYAVIAALAYRQALAAMEITADRNGLPNVYTKEETSNGDTDTVDVVFPASPLLLTFCPQLEAASLVPVLNSADTPRWRFPWAPHDLGTYPVCTGWYASGGENMPVEESGNMIIMACAVAQAVGNADLADRYWPLLTKWAEYLRKRGFDPRKQLSTNDFLGQIAHNANLSIKAIIAMGAYGKLCRMRGLESEAVAYQALARRWAKKWMMVDAEANHYRVAFNQPNSWSMLYNLVWDQVLHLHVFPTSVRRKQMAYYMTKLNKYGLPDRSTVTQTKTDFEIWTASLATKPAEFHAIIDRIYNFLDQSPARVPLADQYGTQRAWAGMHARPVVGAAYMPFLIHRRLWASWVKRGATFGDGWAPLPPFPPQVHYVTIVPDAQKVAVNWRYTPRKPTGRWYAINFDDQAWKRGPAGFGAGYRNGNQVHIRTRWKTKYLFLRRTIKLRPSQLQDRKSLRIWTFHDDDVAFYINGVFAASAGGYSIRHIPLHITREALATLHPGGNVIAVEMHQLVNGQYFDAGIVKVVH